MNEMNPFAVCWKKHACFSKRQLFGEFFHVNFWAKIFNVRMFSCDGEVLCVLQAVQSLEIIAHI